MKSYYRVMLGQKSVYAKECFAGNFIGTDFDIHLDLGNKLPNTLQEFNKEFIPVYLAAHPDKNKIGAGLACGALWTVSKGIQVGDIVLCPDGTGKYRVAEVSGDYTYEPGKILFHRRPVNWLNVTIDREDMSEGLQSSTGVPLTVVGPTAITNHRQEIERFLGNTVAVPTVIDGAVVEDLYSFALEKHLEDFLVQNWAQTDLGREYDIYSDEGVIVGRQFEIDKNRIDILAVSKDKKKLLVVELKKGRASDAVVGQILRYMGFVKEQRAEEGQTVHGVIIAHEDDKRIRSALSMTPNILFYRYEVSFKLKKG